MKRKRRVPKNVELAARTEFMINLNILKNPSDDVLELVKPMEERLCPLKWDKRVRGIRLLLRQTAPSLYKRLQAPFCAISVIDEGMVVIRCRAVWQGRNPVCIGLATYNEVITANYLKKVGDLIANTDRLVISLVNDDERQSGIFAEEDYWSETDWDILPVFTSKLFHRFAESFIDCVLRIPTNVDKRVDKLAVFGDERWIQDMPGKMQVQ